MKKLLLVGCDGTIREPIHGKWISPFDNQRIIEGAAAAVRRFCDQGYLVVGVTNQGGVSAGHKTMSEAIADFGSAPEECLMVGDM